MNPKEWMSRAKNIDNEIQTLEEQKEILFSELTKCTCPTDGERINGGKLNVRDEKLIKYIDLCNKIEQQIIKLIDVKADIINVIDSLENSIYRTLLYERYINFKTWEKISNTINYSRPQTLRIHNQALLIIKTLI